APNNARDSWTARGEKLRSLWMKLTAAARDLIEPPDAAEVLALTARRLAINSGTGTLHGLAQQAEELAAAFAALPGDIALREGGGVHSVDSEGRMVVVEHGRHLVLRVRPQAERRFLLTGHMDTVYPPEH